MRITGFRSFFFLFVVCFVSAKAFSQEIAFKHLTINEGLSQSTVNSIIQDREGVIWVATFGGLNRYNGYEFDVYTHNERDSTSISHNRLNSLFEDKDGNLWIGTVNGLNRFDPATQTFIRYPLPNKGRYVVYDIVQDRQGNLWIATDIGLKFLNPVNKQLSHVRLNKVNESQRIQSLFLDSDGLLWLGFYRGLEIIDIKNRKIRPVPAALENATQNSWIRTIRKSSTGEFWIATEADGTIRFQPESGEITRYTSSEGVISNTVRDLLLVNKDQLWMGTRQGLSVLNLPTGKVVNYSYSPTAADPSSSLSHASVRCMFQDKSGNIWLGTYSGGINLVYNFKKSFFYKGHSRSDAYGLSNRQVNSILQEGLNSFWIGTDGGGLNFWDRQSGKVEVFRYTASSSQSFNSIKSIAKHDDPNKLWLGTSGGLLIFDKRTKAFTEFEDIKKGYTVPFDQNYYLLNLPTGLWVGSNFNGVSLIRNNRVVRTYRGDNPNSINSGAISCLIPDGNKGLWIGHQYRGLNYLDFKTNKVKSYVFDENNPRSLSNNTVFYLFIDSKKRLWIGTDGGGLNYFDPVKEQFFAINKQNGLPNNTIQAIEEDKKGNLWVSTNKGIFRITIKSNALPFKAGQLDIINYTVQDGLQSNQFNQGAVFKSKAGELFFGGINGLTSFFPDRIAVNKYRPDVILTSFKILNRDSTSADASPLNKPINLLDEITLKHNEAYFTIKYAALNYIYPERNQYAYKLEGFTDEEWHYVDGQRTATYTNLDPGTYIFKVKAANNSGVWSLEPRELKITVLPPWWQTKLAYVIYFLLAILLLYLFNYYSKYTERLKNRLEYEADSYRREQELAQKKLSFFINISHEIKTPITMIMAPLQKLMGIHESNPQTFNYLQLMNKSGQRLLNLVDQLLDLRRFDSEKNPLKAEKGNVVAFTQETVILFTNLAKAKEIDLVFNSENEEIVAWFDKDKLEKVLYNLISNAIKYTPSYGKVEVKVSNSADSFLISVADNGSGISKDRIETIFQPFKHLDTVHNNVAGTGIGLAFAKELVELHKGTIEVESIAAEKEKNGFTCFTIKIPVETSLLPGAEAEEDYLDAEDIGNYTNYSLNTRNSFFEKKSEILKRNDSKKFTMLLVEDNPDLLGFLAESFEADFEIIQCTDGLQGYGQATKVIPDIIISDVMMPEMNGIELCGKLKSDMRTSHVPIILLTARSPLIFKIEGLEQGADEYITKPFNFELLEVKVWNLLENRQKMRSRYQKEISLEPTNLKISSFDDIFIEKVMKYIEDNIDEEQLSVEELSDHIGMSRGNLYKKLKALTSKSPVEFIRHVRLRRAAQLLRQHKIFVNEVAFMVGFRDVNYFRKCFKEEFGITPTEYSKSERVSPDPNPQ